MDRRAGRSWSPAGRSTVQPRINTSSSAIGFASSRAWTASNATWSTEPPRAETATAPHASRSWFPGRRKYPRARTLRGDIDVRRTTLAFRSRPKSRRSPRDLSLQADADLVIRRRRKIAAVCRQFSGLGADRTKPVVLSQLSQHLRISDKYAAHCAVADHQDTPTVWGQDAGDLAHYLVHVAHVPNKPTAVACR